MIKGLNRKLSLLEILGEGFALIPFGFTVNGTSDADGLKGPIASAVFSEAGEYLVTLLDNSVPKECYAGFAGVSNTADDVDMYAIVDWSAVVSAGTFVVRCMTGATETTPTDNLLVGGFLLVRKTDRSP
jgi:hypothetical protein